MQRNPPDLTAILRCSSRQVSIAAEIGPEALTSPLEVAPGEKTHSSTDEQAYCPKSDIESTQKSEDGDNHVLKDARDIATHVIAVQDDPSAGPSVHSSSVSGSAFGGVLAEIYYFKPQTVLVSTMFIATISYVVCGISC